MFTLPGARRIQLVLRADLSKGCAWAEVTGALVDAGTNYQITLPVTSLAQILRLQH